MPADAPWASSDIINSVDFCDPRVTVLISLLYSSLVLWKCEATLTISQETPNYNYTKLHTHVHAEDLKLLQSARIRSSIDFLAMKLKVFFHLRVFLCQTWKYKIVWCSGTVLES